MVNIPCLVHKKGLPVDKQLIFGPLSQKQPFCGRSVNFAASATRLSSRWTNSLSSGPCPRKRPHGGHTAMRTRLLHPARTLVLSLALATDVGAESSAVFNLNKKTSQVRYNLTRFADFQTYRGVQSCILPPLCLTRYTQGHNAADNHNTFSR